MHIKCKTAKAVLLLGCESEEGPMRFPSLGEGYFGINLDVDPGLPVDPQLLDKALELFAKKELKRHIVINQQFNEPIDNDTTLYLATIHWRFRSANHKWSTMPDVLKQMPKERSRLAYVKAWQVLTGAFDGQTKAVSLSSVLKFFKGDS